MKKKQLYILFGSLSLCLGLIGIFLPILPTTPFILLSGYFYSKSSKRLHTWLLNGSWTGPLLKDWEESKALSFKIKIKAIVLVLLSICLSMWMLRNHNLIFKGLLIGLGLIGIISILNIKTKK